MQLHNRTILRRSLYALYHYTPSWTSNTHLRPFSRTSKPTSKPKPTPPDGVLAQLTKWSTCLSNDTLIEVHIPKQTPYQVQSALLSHATITTRARIHIFWPLEPPLQPEFLSQPTLDLTTFPPAASLIFLFWLYNRRLPQNGTDFQLKSTREDDFHITSREPQEHPNALWTETWLLGAALGAPAFQNDVMRTLARALEKEEVEAARSPAPHYSSAIPWARKTWDAASGRAEGKALTDFAVDVAAKRVFTVGVGGMVLTAGERKELSGDGFAGEVFGSVGGQIGMRGVRIGELGRAGLVGEM